MKNLSLLVLFLTLVCNALGLHWPRVFSSSSSFSPRPLPTQQEYKRYLEDEASNERVLQNDPQVIELMKVHQYVCILPKRRDMPLCSSYLKNENARFTNGRRKPAINVSPLESSSHIPSVFDYDNDEWHWRRRSRSKTLQMNAKEERRSTGPTESNSEWTNRVKRTYPLLKTYITKVYDSPVMAVLEAQVCVPDDIGVPLCPEYMYGSSDFTEHSNPMEAIGARPLGPYGPTDSQPDPIFYPTADDLADDAKFEALETKELETDDDKPDNGKPGLFLDLPVTVFNKSDTTKAPPSNVLSTDKHDDTPHASSQRIPLSVLVISEKEANQSDNSSYPPHDAVVVLKSKIDDKPSKELVEQRLKSLLQMRNELNQLEEKLLKNSTDLKTETSNDGKVNKKKEFDNIIDLLNKVKKNKDRINEDADNKLKVTSKKKEEEQKPHVPRIIDISKRSMNNSSISQDGSLQNLN